MFKIKKKSLSSNWFRTLPFHGENTGSNLVKDIKLKLYELFLYMFKKFLLIWL